MFDRKKGPVNLILLMMLFLRREVLSRRDNRHFSASVPREFTHAASVALRTSTVSSANFRVELLGEQGRVSANG